VTELTQPLAAAQSEAAQGAAQSILPRTTTFSELVYVHYDWWNALRKGTLSPALAKDYCAARAGFEERHGEIVSAYWCSHVESAVALTHRKRRFRWASPISTFHRESDWATQAAPEIAAELHHCDELAVKAKTVLTGVRQVICLQLVMACAAHLLSLVDGRGTHDAAMNAEALKREQKALDRAQEYYDEASNGQAQVAYFVGMAAVAAVLGIGAAIWLVLDWSAPVAALVAGSLGAVVSVIQRINQGTFTLEYDTGRLYAMFLGGLRPLIGGAFALVLSFAFTGGLLSLPSSVPDADHRKLALLVIAFLAGFSERWAQDTLAAAMPTGSKKA
jgi:uncharacterized membrane protein